MINKYFKILLKKKEIYSFTCLTPAYEELDKFEPMRPGDRHPHKPYIGKHHSDGRTRWYYNPEHAKNTDDFILQNRERFINKFDPKFHPILNNMIDQVSKLHTRHAVWGVDKPEGEMMMRARHLKGLMEGNPNFELKMHSPENITITAFERHGPGDNRHSIWNFSKNNAKVFSKSADKGSITIKGEADGYDKIESNYKHSNDRRRIQQPNYLHSSRSMEHKSEGLYSNNKRLQVDGSSRNRRGSPKIICPPPDRDRLLKTDKKLNFHPATHGSSHFIFSPENPKFQSKLQLNPDEVLGHLKKMGETVEDTYGNYDGHERSFIVHNPKNINALHQLAADLGQESAIYSDNGNHEMHYYHGNNAGKYRVGTGTQTYDKKPNNYYTKITLPHGEDKFFVHNFDWDDNNMKDRIQKSISDKVAESLGFLKDKYNLNKYWSLVLPYNGSILEKANMIRTENRVFVSMDGDDIGASVERAALSDDIDTIIKQSGLIASGQSFIRNWATQHDADIYIDGGDDIAFTLPSQNISDLDALRSEYLKTTNFTITIGVGDSISRAGHAMLYGKLHGKNQINMWSPELANELDSISHQMSVEEKLSGHGLLGKAEGVKLVHYSKQPGLTHVDPAQMGTGVKGAEFKRGLPSVARSYYYIDNTQPESMVVNQSSAKYAAELSPEHSIYDIGKDPDNIYQKLKEQSKAKDVNQGIVSSDEYLQAVKDAGHYGFTNSASALPNAVGLFYKHPVKEDVNFRKSELIKEQYDAENLNPIHGWISPKGEYFHMEPDENHDMWIRTKSGIHVDLPSAHRLDWISVGHTGDNNIIANRELLKQPNHPAMKKLRELVGKHWRDFDVNLSTGTMMGSHSGKIFAETGYLKPIEKSELIKKDLDDPSKIVSLSTGNNKLREVRDFVNKNGGKVHGNDLFTYFGGVPHPAINRLKDSQGHIHSKDVEAYLNNAPKLKYQYSHSTYKPTTAHDLFSDPSHPAHETYKRYYAENPALKDALTGQAHSDEPSKVFQLNVTSDHINEMKKQGVFSTYANINKVSHKSGHPVSKDNGIGWVRYTEEPDGIHIDEIQSDYGQSLLRQTISQATAAKEMGIMSNEDADLAIKRAEESFPEDHLAKIKNILFSGKNPSEILHEAFLQHLRDKGKAGTKLHMWQAEPKADMAGMDTGRNLPGHLLFTYDKLPKSYGYEPSIYGKLSTQKTKHDNPPKTWETTLKKTSDFDLSKNVIPFRDKQHSMEFSNKLSDDFLNDRKPLTVDDHKIISNELDRIDNQIDQLDPKWHSDILSNHFHYLSRIQSRLHNSLKETIKNRKSNLQLQKDVIPFDPKKRKNKKQQDRPQLFVSQSDKSTMTREQKLTEAMKTHGQFKGKQYKTDPLMPSEGGMITGSGSNKSNKSNKSNQSNQSKPLDADFSNRIMKIRASLNKINNLMAELREAGHKEGHNKTSGFNEDNTAYEYGRKPQPEEEPTKPIKKPSKSKNLKKQEQYNEKQLEIGTRIEKEHAETIKQIIADVRAGKVKSFEEYFQNIAEDHLDEYKDYYTRLVAMESKADKDLKKSFLTYDMLNALSSKFKYSIKANPIDKQHTDFKQHNFRVSAHDKNGKMIAHSYIVNREKGISFHNLYINSEHLHNKSNIINMLVSHAETISGKKKISLHKAETAIPKPGDKWVDPKVTKTPLKNMPGWNFEKKVLGQDTHLNFNHSLHGSISVKPNPNKTGYIALHNGTLIGGYDTIHDAGMHIANYIRGLRY